MDTAKIINLCIQINNTVVFSNHTHIKHTEFKNKKHVNSKPKVLSNTMFRISRFRTTDIHRRIERLGHNLIKLQCLLVNFNKHFDIHMNQR